MEKLHSEDHVKMTRIEIVVSLAFVESISSCLGRALVATGEYNVVTRSIFLLKLHCGLEMVFAYRYHGINQPAEFASSLTYSFTLVQNPSIVPIGNCYLSQFSNRDRESGTKSPSL